MDEQKNAADTIATAAQLANESGAALLHAQLKWLDDYVLALLARAEAAEEREKEARDLIVRCLNDPAPKPTAELLERVYAALVLPPTERAEASGS